MPGKSPPASGNRGSGADAHGCKTESIVRCPRAPPSPTCNPSSTPPRISANATGAPRKCWPESSTTPDASGLNRRFRITHPFHPWFGEEFELVTYLHTWGEHRAYFHKEGKHLVSVPATWTDIAAEDPVIKLGAGRSLFRIRDLLELAQLTERFRQRDVKETMS